MTKKHISKIEWQTLSLILIVYAAFAILGIYYHWLPWWMVLAAGSTLVCLHGSLQHEVIHGHPTRSKIINELLVFPAPGLWLPYGIYRDTHLKHHIDEYITDPFEDPESYYLAADSWSRTSVLHRQFLLIRNTVVGRLLIGPAWACYSLLRAETAMLLRRDYSHLRYWAWHMVSVTIILIWLRYCEIPWFEYAILCAYPGLSLTMLRSFLEHQADPDPTKRSVVVQSGKFMGLLFLNNNLHALHHEKPALPWYQLPAEYDRRSGEILMRNGNYFYRGYLDIIRRYFFSPKTHPRHPYR